MTTPAIIPEPGRVLLGFCSANLSLDSAKTGRASRIPPDKAVRKEVDNQEAAALVCSVPGCSLVSEKWLDSPRPLQ